MRRHDSYYNGVSFSIAGVAPPGFRGSLLDWYGDEPVDLFVPIETFDRWNTGRASLLSDRTFTSPQVVGRLRGDVTLDAARLVFDLQSKRLQAEYPDSNGSRELLVLPAARARFWPGRYADTVRLLALVGAGGLLILLLVCGNLINLWLPRIMARRREFALRLAVGAGQTALARPLLFEVPLLTAAAVVCGIGIASELLRGLAVHSAPFGVVLYRELEMNSRSWAFSFGVAACASTVVAAGQWVRAACCRPIDALRTAPGNSEGRASVRGRRVLIAGAGCAFVRPAGGRRIVGAQPYHLSRIDPGYDVARVVSTTVAQSRRELGIRLAFGAGRAHVVLLVLRDALLPSTVGTVTGSSIWWLWAGPAVAREAHGVDSEATAIVAFVAAGLTAVTAAAVHPAFHAANVEPLEATRSG